IFFNKSQILCEHTPNMVENENLGQVQVLLKPLQMELTKSMTSVPKEDTRLLMQCKGRSQAAIKKIRAIQKIVHGKNQKDIGQCCYEDTLKKVTNNGQELSDRKVFLVDELLIFCKPMKIDVIFTYFDEKNFTYQDKFQLEEKLFISKVDIIDRKDIEELKNAFEI
ncbi:Protein son of sevenless, partial [Camponotus floridanus]